MYRFGTKTRFPEGNTTFPGRTGCSSEGKLEISEGKLALIS